MSLHATHVSFLMAAMTLATLNCTVSSVTDVFKSVDNHTMINFIKETNLYHQL